MRRFVPLSLGLALTVALAAASVTAYAPGTTAVVAPESPVATVATMELGCTVSIKARNSESQFIEVDLTESKVKTKGGVWKKIDKAGGVVNGACTDDEIAVPSQAGLQTESCNLDLGCNKKRRYKFKIKRGGAVHYEYYPSASGWTENTTINLRDVSRHF